MKRTQLPDKIPDLKDNMHNIRWKNGLGNPVEGMTVEQLIEENNMYTNRAVRRKARIAR